MTGSASNPESRDSGSGANAHPGMTKTGLLRRVAPRNDEKCVPRGCGTHCRRKTLLNATTDSLAGHFDAVVLFAMFTTCTRRLASASGLLGSLSLLLPYPTVTRSVPEMPNLSVR